MTQRRLRPERVGAEARSALRRCIYSLVSGKGFDCDVALIWIFAGVCISTGFYILSRTDFESDWILMLDVSVVQTGAETWLLPILNHF